MFTLIINYILWLLIWNKFVFLLFFFKKVFYSKMSFYSGNKQESSSHVTDVCHKSTRTEDKTPWSVSNIPQPPPVLIQCKLKYMCKEQRKM